MRELNVLIITNCTSRKRCQGSGGVFARKLPKAEYKTVSAAWADRVQAASPRYLADNLYCGRAVTETIRAAGAVRGDVAFISAGLGVVTQKELVPAYSLTASLRSADSISKRLTEKYEPRLWWRALLGAMGKRRALWQCISERQPALILVALPSTYLEMMQDDLIELPRKVLTSLRIIGPRRVADLPEGLREQWLPYDGRLDNPKTGFNGTTSDFPHRALHHFAKRIFPKAPSGSAGLHQGQVEAALRRYKPFVCPRGVTASDEEILRAIGRLCRKHTGHRGVILREIRGSMGLACEQARFRDLMDCFEEQREKSNS
jgi:hypothetical protein